MSKRTGFILPRRVRITPDLLEFIEACHLLERGERPTVAVMTRENGTAIEDLLHLHASALLVQRGKKRACGLVRGGPVSLRARPVNSDAARKRPFLHRAA